MNTLSKFLKSKGLDVPTQYKDFIPYINSAESEVKKWVDCWVNNYPDPATKKNHFTVPSRLEILTTYLGEVHYGDAVEVRVSEEKIKILPATK